jgi:hypothetical protein
VLNSTRPVQLSKGGAPSERCSRMRVARAAAAVAAVYPPIELPASYRGVSGQRKTLQVFDSLVTPQVLIRAAAFHCRSRARRSGHTATLPGRCAGLYCHRTHATAAARVCSCY